MPWSLTYNDVFLYPKVFLGLLVTPGHEQGACPFTLHALSTSILRVGSWMTQSILVDSKSHNYGENIRRTVFQNSLPHLSIDTWPTVQLIRRAAVRVVNSLQTSTGVDVL